MKQQLIFILNCGSSSLKFAILDPSTGAEKLSGLAEALHLDDARIKWKLNGEKGEALLGAGSAHTEALNFIANKIIPLEQGLKESIVAIGHRIVHGGEHYSRSALIDDKLIQAVKDSASFAPLHNPAGLLGFEAAFNAFPELKNKNVVVFDTAFHQTMPEEAYLYAIPYNLYKEHGVRRYGFHGTSHYYVSREAAKTLNIAEDQINVITCHLGNGGSVTAIRNGKSIDTSMGFTPLEGIVMGTRSGDIDPAIIFYLANHLGMSIQAIEEMLTKKSGLLGLTGVSSDCRYAEDNYASDESAKRAISVFGYRLAKYIGAYMAVIGDRLDAIIFTGGIGENSLLVREETFKHLTLFGYKLDAEKSKAARFGNTGEINQDGTPRIMVIPTNEELIIARDTAKLCL